MKFTKKIISLLMAVLMIFGSLGVGVTAFAAPPKMLTMTVSGTLVDSIVPSAMNNINSYRNQKGYSSVTIDANLTSQARIRVAEILFRGRAGDSVESLPDGNTIYTRFPDYGISTFSDYGTLSAPTVEKLNLYLDSFLKYSDASSYKSVGIAVFTYNADTYFYALASTKAATTTYTDFSNKKFTRNVNVSTQYIDSANVYLNQVNNKGTYNLVTKAQFNGKCFNYFTIPNNQIKYYSSNNGIFKVKGTKGYVKKNGYVNVVVKDNYGNNLLNKQVQVYGHSGSSSWQYKYPKSTKKKTLTCAWYTVSNASGYQIQYSLKKNMKNAKTVNVKGVNTEKKTIKKLKSKKKYYVRVRAYMNQGDGEKVYFGWSSKKAVKVK